MLGIKTFEDGERLVITIEGLDKLERENIVKNFLSSLIGSSVTEASPGNAKAVKVDERVPQTEAMKEIKPEKTTEVEVKEESKPEEKPSEKNKAFTDGPYKGKCVAEILFTEDAKGNTNAFKWVHSQLNSLPEDMKEDCLDNLYKYLAGRYKKSDPKTYPDKLSMNQLNNFLSTQYYAFGKEIQAMLKKKYGYAEKHLSVIMDESKKDIMKNMISDILTELKK